ncbi:MAG: sulfatase [Kiritimatiellae bacterium]|jgi:choline-sulfatase|nr:sulfatase [Kiritimatiellia bacterium]
MRILYLDLDTTRPDHLGCYGYLRNTSPNIDKVAELGVRFNNYYCSDAPCLPSRTAMMSGRFGFHTGVIGHGGTAADYRLEHTNRRFVSAQAKTALPSFLKQQGFYTTYIGGFGERHSTFNYYAGFREIYDTGKGGSESAEDVTPTVLDWIERNASKDNWYLHVNYWDPHTPFRAPAEFGNPFENEPIEDWYTQELIDEHKKLAGPHTIQDIGMYNGDSSERHPRHVGHINDMVDMKRHIDGYDCGINYMDGHIGQLFEAFAKQGVPIDDLAIIISADHGENQGEMGIYAEHGTADQITCRIPMIFKWPGCKAGHVDEGLHYNLDLAPTLASLLGADVPDWEGKTWWDGTSYSKAVVEGEECGNEYIVISQGAHVCQRGVRWGDWMYIRTFHDGYHPFYKDEMLFNLKDDPHELNEISAENPEIVRQGAVFLAEWTAKMKATNPEGYGDEDPMDTVLKQHPEHAMPYHLEGYLSRLEATGRADGAAELRKTNGYRVTEMPR